MRYSSRIQANTATWEKSLNHLCHRSDSVGISISVRVVPVIAFWYWAPLDPENCGLSVWRHSCSKPYTRSEFLGDHHCGSRSFLRLGPKSGLCRERTLVIGSVGAGGRPS